MPLVAGTPRRIVNWAEAEKFCSNNYKRFPNMWLSDYKSEDEGTEHYMEAPTPTGSPRSEDLEKFRRGLSIYGPSSELSNPIFKTSITDIRKVLIEDKESCVINRKRVSVRFRDFATFCKFRSYTNVLLAQSNQSTNNKL